MEGTRILPDLQSALLCEQVRREANGNLFIIGIVDAIPVMQVPATIVRLCTFVRWASGIGKFHQTIRLLAADPATELAKNDLDFEMRNPDEVVSNLSIFSNIKLETEGVYQIEVLIDDALKLRFPLPVVKVQPPPNQAGAPATKQEG